MAVKSSEAKLERPQLKSVATMIREAIERNGYKDVKECARSIKVPYDLFNKVVGGHIPKDAQLVEYAKKLDIDSRELILAAYREKAPEEMKRYFNSVVLLEEHNEAVRELLDLMDSFNSDQLGELLHVARLVRDSPRDHCRKSLALLGLYQEMPASLMEYFDSLVLLALRREELTGLQQFKDALTFQKSVRTGRRSRLHA
ncbi:MAG TPA: hypothetical protein VKB51_04990 [bacterium]|nr:hypothetical protein [bacterium]